MLHKYTGRLILLPGSTGDYDHLKFFYRQLVPESDRLSTCIMDNDIDNFAVSVHAMKSTLSSIGAMKLSDLATKLEAAAKNKDMLYCMEHFPGFKERLSSLYSALSAILPEDPPEPEKEQGELDLLRGCILTAITAADDYDNDVGIKALSGALASNYDTETNALLEKALNAFREYDCDGALEALERIII